MKMKLTIVFLLVLLSECIYPQSPKTAEVKQFLGKPTLFVDGKPALPS